MFDCGDEIEERGEVEEAAVRGDDTSSSFPAKGGSPPAEETSGEKYSGV